MTLSATIAVCLLSGGLSAVLNCFVFSRTRRAATKSREARREDAARALTGAEGVPSLHAEMQGYAVGYGNYRIVSFDRGQTWWNFPQGGEILPADHGLLASIRGWAALSAHTCTHGTVDPVKLTAVDIRALAGAGLVVPSYRSSQTPS